MFPVRYLQKALQRWLQPVLMEVISIDWSTFFLLHHSLDGILLVHETLEWAKTSNQNLTFLKLDFSKAFDKVFWAFSFQCLEKIKLLQGFIQFVRILFVGVETLVNLNGVISRPFPILKGVKQGYLLTPYLFLLVGEALNQFVKAKVKTQKFLRVSLPHPGC